MLPVIAYMVKSHKKLATIFLISRTFTLEQTNFSGQAPHSLPNATRLETLALTSNSFTGNVPANLGNLRNLTVISFSDNQLTGPNSLRFLTDLTNCTKLSLVSFAYNKFRGEIPASVANFTNVLQFLFLGSNHITGNIPPEIEKLNGLQILSIISASISGEIPHGLGYIPPSLGWCRQLQELSLSDNNLNGTIPKEVFGLSSLSLSFDVARNSLTGPLPLEVGNMTQIVHADLSDNKLTGEIPSTLSQCLMLLSLDMAGNLFEGSIPPSLKTLIGLQSLNLSRNRLSGQIPIYFENFTVLKALNLSFNSLEGEVPQEGIFKDKKRISLIGNKELCGGIKELGLPACKVHNTKKPRRLPKLKLSIAVPVSFLIGLTCFIVVVYWRRKSTRRPSAALPTDERFQRGDVYSFGIQLLLELFTGIRPTDVMFKDGWTLHEFVRTAQHKNLLKILDPSLLSAEYPVGTRRWPN
ncbi:hypothetical protein NL676_005856 [Syzygium grande]|nr:hypothetical protein NL676_005856 [Syzygium grande]